MANSTVSTHYDEATARRWLSWLARGMKSRGLTVFMIEDLQPGWLTRGPRFAYTVISSLCLVTFIVLGALAFMLPFRLMDTIEVSQIASVLLLSPFVWVASTAFDSYRLLRGSATRTRNRGGLLRVLRACARSIVVGISTSLIGAPLFRRLEDFLLVLLFGLAAGFILGWISDSRSEDDDIQTVERLEWSWRPALLGVSKAIPISVILSLSFAVLILVSNGENPLSSPDTLRISIIVFAFAAGPVGLCIGGLQGFRTTVSTMKVVPNQGIRESFKNSLLIGGVILVPTAILVFASVRLSEYFTESGGMSGSSSSELVLLSSAIALTLTLLMLLLYGGHDVIRHYSLRLVLSLSNAAPFNIAAFLDYAANDLQILQKVGGGYIFIHRFLLEHFAEMNEEGSRDSANVQSPATNPAR